MYYFFHPGRWPITAAVLLLPLVFLTPALYGQGAAPAASSRAVQLPLSAREPSTVTIQQSTLPPPGSSVNTSSLQIQVSGGYNGSVPGRDLPTGPITLTLQEAVTRGLQTNLGIIGADAASMQARAQRIQARSSLLPTINGSISENAQKINLAVEGFSSSTLNIPVSFPTVVGPFHYYDAHGSLQQSLMDFTAVHNLHSARQSEDAAGFDTRQAREEIVLSVAGVYLQLLASKAEVQQQQAEIQYAEASYQQAQAQVDAGNKAPIEANRSLVELQTERQRLRSLSGDLQKEQNLLARLIGLPLGLEIMTVEKLIPLPAGGLPVDEAVRHAWAQRWDLKTVEAQFRTAQEARKAASAERLPTVSLSGQYGIQGINPDSGAGVFQASVGVNIPIFEGGRIHGDAMQADAVVERRRADLQDERGAVELSVRNAEIDLDVADQQVVTAQSNRELALHTLQQSQDRFSVGVADSVEVVNSQESLAAADHDYVASLFSQYISRIAFAHAMGEAEKDLPDLFKRNQP
jgi:outer membrane protein TolC